MARARRWVREKHCEEFGILLVLCLAAGAIWLFAEIADEVTEGDTHEWDKAIVLAMREPGDLGDPRGPGWVEEIGRDFTALGGLAVSVLVTATVVVYLAMRGKGQAIVLVIVAIGGGLGISLVLKELFDRPRPELVPQLSQVYTASFPSGHSTMAAVTYLTLAALLARLHRRRRIKVYFLAVALVITACVGVSRVYLGVHWPTDVVAGWTLGAAWAMLVWVVTYALQMRGRVEQDVEQEEPDASEAA